MTTASQLYTTVRTHLLEVAATLDEERQEERVPALPLWTVRDTYAHLVGVAADALAGKTEAVGTADWTASQVSQRATRTLAELCTEWVETNDRVDALLSESKGASLMAMDAWHHEQDIRAALDEPVDKAESHVRFILDFTVPIVNGFWKSNAATTRLVATDMDGEWQLGAGDPATTVRAGGYELARAIAGRRSRDQLVAMGWDDPAPHLADMPAFDFAERDIVER